MNTIVDDVEFSNVDGNSNDGFENNEVNRDDIDERYKRIIQLIVNKIWGFKFGSKFETCEFYQIYAKCHSFVVRKDYVSGNLKLSIVMGQVYGAYVSQCIILRGLCITIQYFKGFMCTLAFEFFYNSQGHQW